MDRIKRIKYHPCTTLKSYRFRNQSIKRFIFQQLILFILLSLNPVNSLKDEHNFNKNVYREIDQTSILVAHSREILLKKTFQPTNNLIQLNTSSNYVISSSSSSFSSLERYSLMPIYGYVLSALFLFVIWIVGTSGNFLVMYLVARNKQLQTPMNLILVNLSVADFTMAAFGSPISFTAAVFGGWPFGNTGCVIYAFGMALGGITSISTLMVLAFERFLMIARPFRAADIQNHHSILFVMAIWAYSLSLTLPPLLGWASYGPEAAHISCSVNWEMDDAATSSYIVFLFIMGLVLPLFTIIFSYLGILITIRMTGQSQTTNTSATRRAELRVVGMVATMVSSFMIAWSPYAIFSLLVAFSSSYRKGLTPILAVLPSIFAKSSSCYNPIIYVGLNTQFRAAWLKLLGLQRPRDNDANTALTLSVTVGIPKEPDMQDDSPNTINDTNVESSFISKHDNQKQEIERESSQENVENNDLEVNQREEEATSNTPLLQRIKSDTLPEIERVSPSEL